MFLIFIFILILIWGFSDHEAAHASIPRSQAMKNLMEIKYPFGDNYAIKCAEDNLKLFRKKKPHDLDQFEIDLYQDIERRYAKREINDADRWDLMQDFFQHYSHRRNRAYMPNEMWILDVCRDFPELSWVEFKSQIEFQRLVNFYDPPKLKRPEVWEREKEWLKQWQSSQECVDLWNKYAAYYGYSIPYPYNKEDAERIRAEKQAAMIEKREAEKAARAERREERRNRDKKQIRAERKERRLRDRQALQDMKARWKNTPDL